MKKINNKKSEKEVSKKALIYTVLIVASAIFLIWLIGMALKFPRIYKILLIEDLLALREILSFLTMVCCMILIYTYLKDYLILKNELTAGIIVAIFSLMLLGISLNPIISILIPQFNIFIIQTLAIFFTLISLLVLLWISYR